MTEKEPGGHSLEHAMEPNLNAWNPLGQSVHPEGDFLPVLL